jgi:hypothetical protein
LLSLESDLSFRSDELNKKYFYGAKIESYDKSADIIICSNCFEPLFDQMGRWGSINLIKIYLLDGKIKSLCCDVCGQTFNLDRRRGLDRREYDYDAHVPERRTIGRR